MKILVRNGKVLWKVTKWDQVVFTGIPLLFYTQGPVSLVLDVTQGLANLEDRLLTQHSSLLQSGSASGGERRPVVNRSHSTDVENYFIQGKNHLRLSCQNIFVGHHHKDAGSHKLKYRIFSSCSFGNICNINRVVTILQM